MSILHLFPSSGPVYSLVEADPPWRYNQGGRGAAKNHYKTMSLEAICALPIKDVAAENAALFLWATGPMIMAAGEVIDAWGFEYKTLGFIWTKFTKNGKVFIGNGHATRAGGEVCCYATRGKVKVSSHSVYQTLLHRVREHSRKPNIKPMLREMFPDGRALDVFGRRQHKGWDTFGIEASMFDDDEPDPLIIKGVEEGLTIRVGQPAGLWVPA